MRFYRTPRFISLLYPELTWRIRSEDAIYLTFDDGPDAEVTPWVLEILGQFDAKATFFCLGKNLEANPEMGKRIMDEGHQIGNHTYSHLEGWKTKDLQYLEDVKLGEEVMAELGMKSNLFRPPYGRIRKRQIKILDRKIIMWSHLSWDFDQKLNVEKSIRQLKKAGSGSILVFHDSSRAFKNLKKILPEILLHFRDKGFKFEIIP